MQDQHGNLEVSTQARTDSMQIPTRARCQSTVFPSDQDKCLLLTSPFIEPGCFETGRFTQTHSSWTVVRHRSRKWMSDQAIALVLPARRRRFALNTTLRNSPSAGRPPSPLDFYLSWMSPISVPDFRPRFPPDFPTHKSKSCLRLADQRK